MKFAESIFYLGVLAFVGFLCWQFNSPWPVIILLIILWGL
jgi:hypothetical protein